MTDRETLVRIVRAQEQNQAQLLELQNVIGVATGFRERDGTITDELSVQVFVERKVPLAQIPDGERVPETLVAPEGEPVRTDVIEITVPEAQQDTTRYRPVQG